MASAPELISLLKASFADAEQASETLLSFVELVSQRLSTGESCVLPGIGKFSVRNYPERRVPDLATGRESIVPEHCRVRFRSTLDLDARHESWPWPAIEGRLIAESKVAPSAARALPQAFTFALRDLLSEHFRVEIPRFGTFEVTRRPSFWGRHPETGEAIDVPAKTKILFHAADELKERIASACGPVALSYTPDEEDWVARMADAVTDEAREQAALELLRLRSPLFDRVQELGFDHGYVVKERFLIAASRAEEAQSLAFAKRPQYRNSKSLHEAMTQELLGLKTDEYGNVIGVIQGGKHWATDWLRDIAATVDFGSEIVIIDDLYRFWKMEFTDAELVCYREREQ